MDKKAAFAIYIVIFMAVWQLLEFLYGRFITGSGFQFSVMSNIVFPLVVGAATGYFSVMKKDGGNKER